MYLNQNKGYAIILLIISPLLSLSFALRNLDNKAKLLFLTLFGAIYGLTINYLEGNDAWSHVQDMKAYYNLNLSDFINQAFGIISFNPSPYSSSDLYIHFLFGIAGSIFQSPLLLFTMVGTVYGFFYGSALLKVIRIKKRQKVTLLVFLIITIFVTFRSYDNMQTIRSWTGMWVLFNGVLGYYQTKNKKYVFLMVFSLFFHLMYSFVALPALILIFFKVPPKKLLIGVYLLSFVMNINTRSVINLASNNQLAEDRLGSYYRISPDGEEIDPIANRKTGSTANWYAKYGKAVVTNYGGHYFILFFILAGYYRREIMTNVEFGLFSTGILMAALANFLSFSATFYNRTMNNATLYILAVMVFLSLRDQFKIGNISFRKNAFVWLGVLIFVPRLVYFSSDILYRTSILTILFPFLSFLEEGYNFSIRDFIDLFL